MLLIGPSIVKIIMFRDTVIFLLYNFIEITLWQGCSPVNLLHIFKTPFLKNNSGGLRLNLPFTTSWICYQLEKIDVNTRAENRTFGLENQFSYTRTVTKQTKISDVEDGMSKVAKPAKNIHFRVYKIGRVVDVNNRSSTISKIKLLLPPDAANCILQGKLFLFKSNCLELQLKNRIKMVDAKPFENLSMQTDASTKSWGGNMQRNPNWENVVCLGYEVPHK